MQGLSWQFINPRRDSYQCQHRLVRIYLALKDSKQFLLVKTLWIATDFEQQGIARS